MEHWFDDDVVFLTGGGSGIGRAAAVLFARRGARVVVTDANGDAAAQTAAVIVAERGEAVAAECDVSSADQIKQAIAAGVAHFGKLTCAFNNAGINITEDVNWSEEVFRRTLDVNLFGVMTCMREEIAEMLKVGRGAIVNTASISGLVASEGVAQPGYCASKHGVIGLTKTAALQYAKRSIRVNALCPGVTLTKLVQDVMDRIPGAKSATEAATPMGRLAKPEEMAEAAVWLASAKASFVTGHSMIADGGLLAQ